MNLAKHALNASCTAGSKFLPSELVGLNPSCARIPTSCSRVASMPSLISPSAPRARSKLSMDEQQLLHEPLGGELD